MKTEMELPLTGGNSAVVVRVGNTVRRESGFWTPQVHRLLLHLKEKGISEAPLPLGFDSQGREVLTFLPGVVGNDPLPEALRSDAVLTAAARLLRRLHDATQDVAPAWRSGWQAPTREPVEVIGHGDFAPYNCVFDNNQLAGVIDFDHAHACPRLWDLAYALYRFAPLTAPSNPDGYGDVDEQCRRARLFCDAYGLKDRSMVIETVKLRLAYMADYLLQGAARGNLRMQANIAAGHVSIYTTDYAHIDAHYAQFSLAIA
jgi:hypothetical protein